jgi:hypothetical protein
VPGGQAIVGTHVGDGEHVRREAYGGVAVEWTSHYWQPEQLAELLAAAGLEPVVELRFPPMPPSMRPQVLLVAARPA